MRILYIYRHSKMGFSIGKVFKPIEEEMRKYVEVDVIYMPVANYSLRGILKNVKAVQNAVKVKQYDIVHITGTEHYLIPFLRGQRIVVTVHDLGFWVNHPKTIYSVLKYMLWIKTLKGAWRVTFISDKTYKECSEFVTFVDGQPRVVYNPVGAEFHYSPKPLNMECPRILHIGTKSNKNLNNSILALKGMRCHLRIIGQITEAQRAMMDIYGIEYSQTSNLTDEQIKREYEDCDIVNFPSFYEGFGMPIIEGQATGRPVLTSNMSPMNDIAGDGAVFVNPADISSIHMGYDMIKQKPAYYIEKGLENVKRYSLSNIVQQYLELYKESKL